MRSGRFYPPDARTPEARLRFFAQAFPITEIDTSFYAIPEPHVVERWAEWTPAGFLFDVKAFRLFTGHRTPMKMLPPEVRPALDAIGKEDLYYADVRDACPDVLDELWSRFRASIDPLVRVGRLGVVLLQIAPWYVRRTDVLMHVEECVRRLDGLRVALETRNKSWFSPHRVAQTLAFERDLGLAHVVVDEPQGFASSVPLVWAVTNPDVAVVRLHGRNRAMWHGNVARSAAERFDYLYPDEELRSFVDPVLALSRHATDVHVLFNNCHEDNAQRNAATFTNMVAARQAEAVAPAPPASPA